MAMNVQIEAYTKTGFKVTLTQNVRDDNSAKLAMATPDRLGLLPEKPEKPDETEYAKISHVALTSKEDGALHVAFYHANEKMLSRYTHQYFDTDDDKTAFEQWSGLKLADMPTMPDNSHPQRDKPTFKKYAVALDSARALIRKTTYTKTDEGYEPIHGVERYIGSSTSSSADTTSGDNHAGVTLDTWKAGDAEAESVRAFLVEEGITEEEALNAVPASNWNAFPNAVVAMKVIADHLNKVDASPKQDNHFKSVPGAGADGFKKYQQQQDNGTSADDSKADESLELDDIPF